MNMVYIVMGMAEIDYSNFEHYPVAVYTEKQAAEIHCAAANEYAKGYPDYHREETKFVKNNPWDKKMRAAMYLPYTYYIAEAPLLQHPDQYQD